MVASLASQWWCVTKLTRVDTHPAGWHFVSLVNIASMLNLSNTRWVQPEREATRSSTDLCRDFKSPGLQSLYLHVEFCKMLRANDRDDTIWAFVFAHCKKNTKHAQSLTGWLVCGWWRRCLWWLRSDAAPGALFPAKKVHKSGHGFSFSKSYNSQRGHVHLIQNNSIYSQTSVF